MRNFFFYPNDSTDYLKFETKISWVMIHHLNKYLHSEKSDQPPLFQEQSSDNNNNNNNNNNNTNNNNNNNA